jgi:hypothetical protein
MKHLWGCLILSGALIPLVGCSSSDPPIESYTVAKTNRDTESTEQSHPHRMLAAVISAGDQAWFWKVAGPREQVDQVEGQFDQLLQSHRPTEGTDGPPFEWQLPEGWESQEGDAVRTALVRIDAAPDVEVSLTALPLPEMDYDQYLLMNVNRWRRQLGRAPIGMAELPEMVETNKVGSLEIAHVDLAGTMGDSAMPPFAGSAASSSPPADSAPFSASGSPSGVPTFTVPEGWQSAPAGGMRKAAFQVIDSGRRVEITVIDLGPLAGDVLSNVNRWRSQVQLSPIDEGELDETGETMTISGHTAKYVELENPQSTSGVQAIYSVILPDSGSIDEKIWFITMKGDLELAQRERDHFREFVSSLEL